MSYSVANPEAGSIPVYSVSQLEAIAVGGDAPNATDVVDGFAIVDEEPTKETRGLHRRHAEAAKLVIDHTFLLPDEEEGLGTTIKHERTQFYGRYTPPHMDGLSARYYQCHTSIPENKAIASHVQLDRYDLNDDEHAGMMAFLARDPITNGMAIANLAMYRKTKDEPESGMSGLLQNRAPDATWTHDAGHSTTIVFPNGYDARRGSRPASVYVHTVWSKSEDPNAFFQTRKVVINRVQRVVDARHLDGRGPRWTFLPSTWKRTPKGFVY